MFSSSKQTFKKAKGFFILLFLIGVLKLISFVSPLLVNRVSSSVESFGVFEYSFNLGQILIPLLSMGLSGGYAFYVLKHKQSQMTAAFHFHFAFLTIVALLIAFFYPKILNSIYYGAALIALSFSNQIFISGIKKIEDKNYSSVLIESGLYLILFGIVLSVALFQSEFDFYVWFLALLIYNVLITLTYHYKHIRLAEIKKDNFAKIYVFGAKVMVAGVLVFLLCNSTRVFTKFFLNETSVGIYSIVFRIGAASILIYKTIVILIYKNLFLSSYDFLDRTFAKIVLAVFVINISLLLIFPHVSALFVKDTFLLQKMGDKFIFTIFMQIVLWVSFSLLEPIFQRENKVLLQVLISTISVITMLALFWGLDKYYSLDLLEICLINNLMISLSSVVAVLVLKRNNVILRKTLGVNLFLLLINGINVFV